MIFEDEHLLVVNKPPGWNTHAPSPYSGEGLYDWLRNREPRWSKLAIIHRLDKETSGVIVFSKSATANRSLTEQFTKREVRKRYRLLTDRQVAKKVVTIKDSLVRVGDKYVSRPLHAGGNAAETRFLFRDQKSEARDQKIENRQVYEVDAEPLTGRTHQIRVHAAEAGFPILGDTLYGGTAAVRVYLHAAELTLKHPASREQMRFHAPIDFDSDAKAVFRNAFIEPEFTTAYRLSHGESDGWPGFYVDRLGDFLLAQSESELTAEQNLELERVRASARGAYHKKWIRHQMSRTTNASPCLITGAAAPERFVVRENGMEFELSFTEGCSVGLFLDQRDNRRRLLRGHIAADFELPWQNSCGTFETGRVTKTPADAGATAAPQTELLNAFAYTCSFSVCAAKAGIKTTSIDLSRKYLDWGKRNFELNGLAPAEHDFICGDVFEWFRRLAKKRRLFDVVILDPPTFSQSKESGIFRAEKDFAKLVVHAIPLLKRNGILFVSTNAANWPPESFLETTESATHAVKRKILQTQYFPQPPDFPISRAEPGYLKTVWLRIA